MESLSADVIDERLRAFVNKKLRLSLSSFYPSRRWVDTGILLDSFPHTFEPHIKMTDEGVWSVEINGSPACIGLDLKALIARAFATSTLLGDLNANKPDVPDAKRHGRDLPLSRSRALPESPEKDGR